METSTREILSKLQYLIVANGSVDWRSFSFGDPDLLQKLRWPEHAGEREHMLPWLMAYQRMLRILPPGEERRALPLLTAGFHSALQIAGLPRAEFARRWAELFPDEPVLGEIVQRTAISRRGQVFVEHIKAIRSSEPRPGAARIR